MTTELKVHIDKKQLEEVAGKKIEELERLIRNTEKREARLKQRVAELEENEKAVKDILTQVHGICMDYAEDLDLPLDYA